MSDGTDWMKPGSAGGRTPVELDTDRPHPARSGDIGATGPVSDAEVSIYGGVARI